MFEFQRLSKIKVFLHVLWLISPNFYHNKKINILYLPKVIVFEPTCNILFLLKSYIKFRENLSMKTDVYFATLFQKYEKLSSNVGFCPTNCVFLELTILKVF